VHLAVIVDGHDPHHGNRSRVAGQQHRSELHRREIACVGGDRPALAGRRPERSGRRRGRSSRPGERQAGRESSSAVSSTISQQARHERTGLAIVLHDLGARDAPVIVPYDHQGSDIEHGALNGPALARIRWSSTARLRSTVTWRAGLLPSHAEEARPPHGLDVVEGISGQDLQVTLVPDGRSVRAATRANTGSSVSPVTTIAP